MFGFLLAATGCRNFIFNTIAPDVEKPVDALSITSNKVQEQLQAMLGTKIYRNYNGHSASLAKKMYKACMNETVITEHGLQPVLDKLESLGGWPVLKGDQWNDLWNWQQACKDFRKLGYSMNYIFNLDVKVNPNNSHSRIIVVSLVI